MSLQEIVNGLVTGKKVVVFSKTTCPYCARVKELLRKYKIPTDEYGEVELDKAKNGGGMQAVLQRTYGQRTVPQVFIGGKLIGGFDDTQALDRQNKLKDMIKS